MALLKIRLKRCAANIGLARIDFMSQLAKFSNDELKKQFTDAGSGLLCNWRIIFISPMAWHWSRCS